MSKEIKIIEVKEINANGKKFLAYKTIDKNGKKMDVRFTRECSNKPTEACIITVDDNAANVDTNRQYPVLWVKDVLSSRPFERKNNLAEFFDDHTEDLPY